MLIVLLQLKLEACDQCALHWLSPLTGPHPELTVAAAVLVLLVIVIISLIVLVVIWKQVLPAAFCIHSFTESFMDFNSFFFMII